jgi:hypothetical protein
LTQKLFIEIGSHLAKFVQLLIENVATFVEMIPALLSPRSTQTIGCVAHIANNAPAVSLYTITTIPYL